jgi:prepilin signal peptidase PulO-like enzyme (type II secretory pathway)
MPPFPVFPWTWALPADLPVAEACVIALACVWGSMFGSFLNVVVHRLPQGRSVVKGGSACPACGSAVRWRDNIPVIGWLLLGGRCRDCGAAISVGYPLVEAISGILAALVAGMMLVGAWAPDWLVPGGTGGPPPIDRPVIDRIIDGDWRPVLAWLLVTAGLLAVLAGTLLAIRRLTKRS